MPKTLLFETELNVDKAYVDSQDEVIDIHEFIKPGMTFTMNYTQTKNYVSEEATTQVTVVSICHIIDGCCDTGIHVMGCVLKTEAPIFICAQCAELGREIILLRDSTRIATGYVNEFLDECREKWKYASS